jgi:hypothetical protein
MSKKTEPLSGATNKQNRSRRASDPLDDVARWQQFEQGLAKLLRPRKKTQRLRELDRTRRADADK